MGQWLAAAEKPNPNATELGAAAALRLMLARELGLPLRAASELSMIRGRLVISAQLLRALAHREGYRIVAAWPSRPTAAPPRWSWSSTGARARAARPSPWTTPSGPAWSSRAAPGRSTPSACSGRGPRAWAVKDYLPDVSLGLVTSRRGRRDRR